MGMGATLRMGATYLIVALLRIVARPYSQCSNAVRGTYPGTYPHFGTLPGT